MAGVCGLTASTFAGAGLGAGLADAVLGAAAGVTDLVAGLGVAAFLGVAGFAALATGLVLAGAGLDTGFAFAGAAFATGFVAAGFFAGVFSFAITNVLVLSQPPFAAAAIMPILMTKIKLFLCGAQYNFGRIG